MGNETEKDFRQQHPNPAGTADQSKKDPMNQGGQNPNQQDPSKKNPTHGDDPRQRSGEEGSEQVEKRRAS
jgi:hypothetical protein